jgi:mediator of RNA polymerase II transcription subunit 17
LSGRSVILYQVDNNDNADIPSQATAECLGICDLIYSVLHALLLRMHDQLKASRLGSVGVIRNPLLAKKPVSPMLQPIIDLLQYQVFCERVRLELDRMNHALSVAGIPSVFRFDPIGEVGKDLVKLFDEGSTAQVSGEAILRIDDRSVCKHSLHQAGLYNPF